MLILKSTVLVLAIALSVPLLAAPMGGSADMGMMNMPMMKSHMAEMKTDMGKMAAAKNDGERMQIMQAHMVKMHDHMEMMMGMMEMMGGQGGGMQSGGIQAGAPAIESLDGGAEGQHDHEAVQ